MGWFGASSGVGWWLVLGGGGDWFSLVVVVGSSMASSAHALGLYGALSAALRAGTAPCWRVLLRLVTLDWVSSCALLCFVCFFGRGGRKRLAVMRAPALRFLAFRRCL